MVGIVAASHSPDIVKGICDVVCQMAPSAPFAAAGGTLDGSLGSDPVSILNAVKKADQGDGVIILFDLGSTGMNARMAVEMLPCSDQSMYHVSNAALIEGSMIAAVESVIGRNINEIEDSLKNVIISKLD